MGIYSQSIYYTTFCIIDKFEKLLIFLAGPISHNVRVGETRNHKMNRGEATKFAGTHAMNPVVAVLEGRRAILLGVLLLHGVVVISQRLPQAPDNNNNNNNKDLSPQGGAASRKMQATAVDTFVEQTFVPAGFSESSEGVEEIEPFEGSSGAFQIEYNFTFSNQGVISLANAVDLVESVECQEGRVRIKLSEAIDPSGSIGYFVSDRFCPCYSGRRIWSVPTGFF